MSIEPNKQRLFDDIKAKPDSECRRRLCNQVALGVYSDFGSCLACPVLTLVADLKAAGFDDLASNAANGLYDHNY